MDKYELEKDKDALFRGEFEVVRELVAALPAGDVSILSYMLTLFDLTSFCLFCLYLKILQIESWIRSITELVVALPACKIDRHFDLTSF